MKQSYLKFIDRPALDSRGFVKGIQPKTQKWEVMSVSGFSLGEIKWFGAWRQYGFFPNKDTIFSTGCMQDIIGFITKHMESRKKSK